MLSVTESSTLRNGVLCCVDRQGARDCQILNESTEPICTGALIQLSELGDGSPSNGRNSTDRKTTSLDGRIFRCGTVVWCSVFPRPPYPLQTSTNSNRVVNVPSHPQRQSARTWSLVATLCRTSVISNPQRISFAAVRSQSHPGRCQARSTLWAAPRRGVVDTSSLHDANSMGV